MIMIKERKTNSVRVMRSLYITGAAMVLTQLVLFLQFKSTELASTIAKPDCQDSCGGIPIPYPFGIGLICSLSQVFNVTCDTTYNNITPTPSLGGNFPIWNITLSLGQARVGTLVSSQCYNTMTKKEDRNIWGFRLGDTYWVNNEKNKFIVIGCNTLGFLTMKMKDNSNYSVGCLSSCDSLDTLNKYGSCSGIGCCQTAISKQTFRLSVNFENRYSNSEVYNFSRCRYAMVVEETHFKFDTTYITTDWLTSSQKKGHPFYSSTLPMVLNWAIGNMACDIAQKDKSSYACKSSNSVCLNSTRGYGGYICNCSDGYQGNPYLNEGCQDIDDCANPNACIKPGKCHNIEGGHRCSCPFGWRSNHNNPRECDLNGALLIGIAAGIVALLIVGFGIYVALERRNLSKVKHKHFEQHGGWILLEKMKSNHGFSFTIFTKKQLEQATNNFDSANILGHGGHGTVYRGTLRDETVAIKKCKIVNESKKQEFGKEMLILSQINHKNIVKILGCCLEDEVPMLVYEFIANGTLNHYIHIKNQGSHISLTTRLRIANESAEALAYLHTSASPPIFHGDVKSANILLDQNFTAKVSDFGSSILAPTDEAQFVTFVQGTCGYLDPEYMHSCKLTDKSDVYSFGVVLLELLTRRSVIVFDVSDEAMSLSSHFLSAMEENKMQELLDDEIKHGDDMELISAVAELAKECLRIKGEERPMMKEVAEELHRISKLKQHPWGQSNPEEREILLGDRSHDDIEIEHAGYFCNIDKEAEESIAIGR